MQWVVLIALTLCEISSARAALPEGLYVSNGTDILRVDQQGSRTVSIYKSSGGRIVGLDFSYSTATLFWSDISLGNRGIYRGTTDSNGMVNNATLIVSDDVLEVNGLSVNWASNLVYWTDGRKRTVEVADFSGNNRRILVSEQLSQPRGIVADPVNGYLFWNDQGYHQIERSRLDGSDRRTIVQNSSRIYWPNQMVVSGSKLYWVDSQNKTLESSGNDGNGRVASVSLSATSGGNHVFGLAMANGLTYITSWSSSVQLITVNTANVISTIGITLGTGSVFSAIYVSSSAQPSSRTDPCSGRCSSSMCLPVESGTFRCACPSFGGKTLRSDNTCQTPTRILLYALADSGYVGFYDPDAIATYNDLYFVYRSTRPVAVAYDPTTQIVYWSDVRERTIHRANLDGTNHFTLLDSNQGIGIVDGLALDYAKRQLYYTNIGSMSVDDKTYSWHKVETVHLGTYKVRTIVSSIADKPRAIALDSTNGYLYYTDWGTKASVVRTNLDGSSPVVIRVGLNNPNGLAIKSGKLYVVDSNFKTRSTSTLLRAKLYSMTLNSYPGVWQDETIPASLTLPFGLTVNPTGSEMYVSDWDTKQIMDVNTSRAILSNVNSPMDLQYSVVTLGSSPDPCPSCSEVCVPSSSSTTCTCNSYTGRSQGSTAGTCTVPGNYLLVADMDGVKMIGLGVNDRSIYVAAVGRPFFSNVVALTYDPTRNIAFYSDVNRKAIYLLSIQNSTSTELYRVNHVIDSMTYADGTLYWTDFLNGLIVSLNLSSSTLQHQVILSNLNKPRAIKIYNGKIYWTEWGSQARVGYTAMTSYQANYLTGIPTTINIRWPNGLFFDGNKMYIADGHPTKRQLIVCDRPTDGTSCNVHGNVRNDNVEHMYDIWISNGIVYYTNWETKSVNALSLASAWSSTPPLATGLMRPSQMYFVTGSSSGTSACPVSGCDSCFQVVNTPSEAMCACTSGRTLFNDTSCVASSTQTCSAGGQSYNIGSSVTQSCQQCRCLTSRLYANQSTGFTCETPECPVDSSYCQNLVIPQSCCPICGPSAPTCGVKITNCPQSPGVRVQLPNDASDVVYEFLPTVRDCLGLARDISSRKTPVGDVYAWKGTDVAYDITVTSSAQKQGGTGVDSDTCTFKLYVDDVTPPKIQCPDTVYQYTHNDVVAVQWSSPSVSDNVAGVSLKAEPSWGSQFRVGQTPVKYTATDKAGNTNTCTFNVIVIKTDAPDSCIIPHVQHGYLNCSAGTPLVCRIVCNSGYVYQTNVITSTEITCSNNQWNPVFSEKQIESGSCLKKIGGTLQGSVGVTAKNVCLGGGGVQLDYTAAILRRKVEQQYLVDSLFDLRTTVKTNGCGGLSGSARKRRDAASDVDITITVAGDYQDTSEQARLKQDIDYIKDRIRDDLLKNFLKITFRNDTDIWSASELVNPTGSDATQQACPPGSKRAADGNGCYWCPPGTYGKETGSETCVDCPAGTYNGQDGQTSCTQCPSDRPNSSAGANIIDECTLKTPGGNDTKDYTPIIVGVVVGVGGGLLVIAIIIIVVVVIRKKKNGDDYPRRRHSPDYADYGSQKLDNPAYAEIDFPDNDKPKDNHYEGLGNAKDDDEDHKYDSIGKDKPL